MSNNIEEDIKYINQDLDILINNIINLPEITATAIKMNKQPLLLKFESILVDREILLKENEELLEVKISASVDNIIRNLEKDNFKLRNELENKRREYQDTYKDVREEIKALKIKANKYDELVDETRCKINERQFELQQEYKDFKEDIRLNTLQEIYYMFEEKKDGINR